MSDTSALTLPLKLTRRRPMGRLARAAAGRVAKRALDILLAPQVFLRAGH